MMRIINQDALTGLRGLPNESVHVVVTSPPYWNLRNYERCDCSAVRSGGVSSSTLEIGPKSGNVQLRSREPDPNCKKCKGTGKQADLARVWYDGSDRAVCCVHEWGEIVGVIKRGPDRDHSGYDHYDHSREITGKPTRQMDADQGRYCKKCGVWRGQLGLEPTPEMYVKHIVEIMGELWRVLRNDGIVWFNIGDSYSRGVGRGGSGTPTGRNNRGEEYPGGDSDLEDGNLLMIPFQVAMALQADGWIVRMDTIWGKGASFGPYVGNVMPEPCNGWRWEQHRIKVAKGEVLKHGMNGAAFYEDSNVGERENGTEWAPCPGCELCNPNDGLVLRKGAWRPTKTHEYVFILAKTSEYYCDKDAIAEPLLQSSLDRMSQDSFWNQEGGEKDGLNPNRSSRKALENLARKVGENMVVKRNVRSVWQIGPQPYAGAHFAVFPKRLVEPMLKVSTSESGCCPKCLTPMSRVTRLPGGFRPSCECKVEGSTMATVLDPFCGSGTTLVVAKSLGLNGIGIEPNGAYVKLIEERLAETPAAAHHAEDYF